MHQPPLRGELLAEFLGTFTLIVFGNGVVAMTVLFSPSMPGDLAKGDWTNINLGWGLGVVFGIYVAGRVSGAHINPAVTLAFAMFRGFPWRKVLPYSLAQTAGGFTAAALVFANYYPAFGKVDPGLEKTAGIFATFPAFPNSLAFGLLDQVIGTALLLMLICAGAARVSVWRTAIANGDLRLSANQKCWPAQQRVEEAVTAAIRAFGFQVERGHPYDAAKGHGFIDSQKRGMEVFRGIPPDAPLVVVEPI
jgi:MIP family channel proteins